jgi:hypothetical protein
MCSETGHLKPVPGSAKVNRGNLKVALCLVSTLSLALSQYSTVDTMPFGQKSMSHILSPNLAHIPSIESNFNDSDILTD